MCTVSYIPTSAGFILTSSRDESVYRPTLAPERYFHNGNILIYPKDELAGGTWIAANNNGRMACLLNGAFENHIKKEKYEKSRGQVLLESFEYESCGTFYKNVNLIGVEPFTLLLIDKQNFNELRWDGRQKHIKTVNPAIPEIWSSVTLYNQEAIEQRRKWFFRWIKNKIDIPGFDIAGFHSGFHGENMENDIVMKRNGGLQTLSISQIIIRKNSGHFSYIDLVKKETHRYDLNKDKKLT
ncbi:MAG: NRDE family protein [Bacteroidetes bacterium]|nr:NRDE family protein [Bacteroidota bacterium]HET6244121.1 NRDE family protein [Bacteroidia bacterium]